MPSTLKSSMTLVASRRAASTRPSPNSTADSAWKRCTVDVARQLPIAELGGSSHRVDGSRRRQAANHMAGVGVRQPEKFCDFDADPRILSFRSKQIKFETQLFNEEESSKLVQTYWQSVFMYEDYEYNVGSSRFDSNSRIASSRRNAVVQFNKESKQRITERTLFCFAIHNQIPCCCEVDKRR
jgi:hypothetical protein